MNIKLSSNTIEFLDYVIFPMMNIVELNENNIETVVEFISNHFEIPLSNNNLKKEGFLLKLAANAITELTKKI